MKDKIEINEIVQLDPLRTENVMFAGCFMVVTNIKDWGVQGYVQGLGEKGRPADGQAYYRAPFGTFAKTGGKAIWVAG